MNSIHSRLQAAKTLPSLVEACTQAADVVKFTIEGSHGCVLLSLWARYPSGVVVEHVHRFRTDARQQLVVFFTGNFDRKKRLPLVQVLSQQFTRAWVARFFNVSGATITSDLKTFE